MSLLDTASLIVTPNGYKEGTLYSVIPSDGSGDMSVVRATTATRVNSAGLVELVPYNLVSYSEQIDNSAWTKENATISANAITAPNGTLTADLITSSSSSYSDILQGTAQSSGNTYTLSCYAKKGSSDWIFLRLTFAAAAPRVWFNVNTGTIGTIGSGLTATIESVGDGWYRCSITGTASATPPADRIDIALANADASTSPNVGNSAYVWGCQLNEGTLPKDYQKTETRLNIPRLDYSNGTCPSLLVEPQRTNLLTYSSSFDNGAWGAIDTTITANTTISPSGVQDAETMAITSSTSRIFQTLALGAGTYTASIYVKSLSGTPTIQFRMVVDGSDITQTIPTTTEWVRHDFTFTASVAVSFFVIRGESGTGSVAIWGAQLEAGSYPTSYIPTTSASVTRNADVVSKTGISSLIGQTEGTMFLDVDFNNIDQTAGVNTLMTLNNGTTANEISILLDTPSGANKTLLGLIRYSNSYDVLIYAPSPITATRYKIALSYKLNDVVLYINGTQIGTDTSTAIPSTSNLSLNSRSDNSFLNTQQEYVKASALWKTRLTNTQLAQLTTI